jgi:hypothetical protein
MIHEFKVSFVMLSSRIINLLRCLFQRYYCDLVLWK